MMKIKIISATYTNLEAAIDKWVNTEQPQIISSSITNNSSWITIAITYEPSNGKSGEIYSKGLSLNS